MLFNSIEFALFCPVVFLLYWYPFRSSRRAQNALLLIASYVFYGWWDWRFLGLIFVSSLVDFLVGLVIDRVTEERARRAWLMVSLCTNLGLLGLFKYYGFFVDSLAEGLQALGIQASLPTLRLVLPVGISFYTFQTLSYTIDVFRRQTTATRDLLAFFAFVSFFPQLVAGPIERAASLLPQFQRERTWRSGEAREGLRQILWGLFKKVVVADNCALQVNAIFEDLHSFPASTLILGAVLFAFQIYGDFSGYSDIAIGTARLFGFRLMRNFALPYFSRDIAEFWRRWHISLSSWFRDYVYIPLGGSRVSRVRAAANIVIVFVVSGLWHGANWTFVVWGLLNGLCFLPLLFGGWHRKHLGIVAEDRCLPRVTDALAIVTTFSLTCLGWIFFRAPDLATALRYLRRIFSPSLLQPPGHLGLVPLLVAFVAWEWFARRREHGLAIGGWPILTRWLVYLALCYAVLAYGEAKTPFIYFQF